MGTTRASDEKSNQKSGVAGSSLEDVRTDTWLIILDLKKAVYDYYSSAALLRPDVYRRDGRLASKVQ